MKNVTQQALGRGHFIFQFKKQLTVFFLRKVIVPGIYQSLNIVTSYSNCTNRNKSGISVNWEYAFSLDEHDRVKIVIVLQRNKGK